MRECPPVLLWLWYRSTRSRTVAHPPAYYLPLGQPWWSMQEDKRAHLSEVIDEQATTGHDQLEPVLGIGEDANILQGVTINNEQIGRRSRRYDAHLPLQTQ